MVRLEKMAAGIYVLQETGVPKDRHAIAQGYARKHGYDAIFSDTDRAEQVAENSSPDFYIFCGGAT